MGAKQYRVPGELDGARLDKAVVTLARDLSRARVKRAIEGGAVWVNGRRRPKGAVVSSGDVIALGDEVGADARAAAVPEPEAPLLVRYESAAVLVLDKPAGQPTVPLRAHETGTLANALVGRYPELGPVGYGALEPGLVHRLDTETSGLVIAARTAAAFSVLADALKKGEIDKEYLLVCSERDLPSSGTIEFPIANHAKDQRRVYPCIHPRDIMRYSPRPAKTTYHVQRRANGYALVGVTVARAIRHQIRAHFAAIGHPIAGDTLYGAEPTTAMRRHALHASRVAFGGTAPVEPFDVTSPLPHDMMALLGA